MIYIYGELEGVDGIKANPLFKDAISNATLVYTDDKVISDNYKKIGVKVNPITVQKIVKESPKKTIK